MKIIKEELRTEIWTYQGNLQDDINQDREEYKKVNSILYFMIWKRKNQKK